MRSLLNGKYMKDIKKIVVSPVAPSETDVIWNKGDKLYRVINNKWTLVGGAGINSAEVSVKNTTGTPSATAEIDGNTLKMEFSGLKGETGPQGNSGYQGAAGELEVVNNLTQGGATAALSAEQGKVLKEEITELESEIGNYVSPLQEIANSRSVLMLDNILIPKNTPIKVRIVSDDLSGRTILTDQSSNRLLDGAEPNMWYDITTPNNDIIRLALSNYSGATINVQLELACGMQKEINNVKGAINDIGNDVQELRSNYKDTISLSAFSLTIADALDYSKIELPCTLKKGAVIVNKGIVLAFAADSSLADRQNVESGETIVLENDLNYCQTLSVVGKVEFDYQYLQDAAVVPQKLSMFEKIGGVNLLNEDAITKGFWINASGTESRVSDSYGHTDYIPVKSNEKYYLSNVNGNPLADRATMYIAFYDAQQVFISSISAEANIITTPSNAAYMRASVCMYLVDSLEAQIEEGDTRTDYAQYVEPTYKLLPQYLEIPRGWINGNKLENKSITTNKLTDDAIANARPKQLSCMSAKGTIGAGGTLQTELLEIAKNTLLSASIVGNPVGCHVGYMGSTYGAFVEIKEQNLIIYKGNGNELSRPAHGLDLSNGATLNIVKGTDASAKITISNEYGKRFTYTENAWGNVVGNAFIKNNGSTAISGELSFMPRDLDKLIWLFGDSYLSFYEPARWLYYLDELGLIDSCLVHARGGENATEGREAFERLLSMGGRPSYAIWLLGMNRGGDENGNVNAVWMTETNRFLSLCEKYKITPILSTIPSVPNIIHSALNAWVKDSGYRYIDMAAAVESANDVYWKGYGTDNQMLSYDLVHPSNLGASALCQRFINDFVEIGLDL